MATISASLAAHAGEAETGGKYVFDGKISREVLENYLARSFHMLALADSKQFDEDLRMIKNVGAKQIGRVACIWWSDEGITKAGVASGIEEVVSNVSGKVSGASTVRYEMAVDIDTTIQAYRVTMDGREALGWLTFSLPSYHEQRTPELPRVESVERLVFRTGPYRGIDMRPIEPAVDRPIPATVFYLNEVTTCGEMSHDR